MTCADSKIHLVAAGKFAIREVDVFKPRVITAYLLKLINKYQYRWGHDPERSYGAQQHVNHQFA